ncbi:unnamed protein product [Linum trigynum]|uniref:Uncharacterized protein n=1 Tax=Linum trigynum TaxID=586398 RepID=A0AAV2F1N9_9ROSI
MAKLGVVVFLLALIAMYSTLQTLVMASNGHGGHHYNNKCLCVPPGYYGNKAVCPCYNNWKTQQGGPKCP